MDPQKTWDSVDTEGFADIWYIVDTADIPETGDTADTVDSADTGHWVVAHY